jgi:hypothetical protein
MDRTTRIGVMLLGGLGLTALLVMLLVLFLGVKLWIGLLLLAALDIAEFAWAYDELIRKQAREPGELRLDRHSPEGEPLGCLTLRRQFPPDSGLHTDLQVVVASFMAGISVRNERRESLDARLVQPVDRSIKLVSRVVPPHRENRSNDPIVEPGGREYVTHLPNALREVLQAIAPENHPPMTHFVDGHVEVIPRAIHPGERPLQLRLRLRVRLICVRSHENRHLARGDRVELLF